MPSTSPSLRQVAACAANRLEGCLAGLDLRGVLVVGRLAGDGRKAAHVVDQEVAFVLVHVEAAGREAGKAWVGGLVAAGDFEPHFAGGGRKDEFLERGGLCLPAKAADTSILEAADSPLDVGRGGRPPLRGGLDRFVRDGVDPARPEQRRRVSLRAADEIVPCWPGTDSRQAL